MPMDKMSKAVISNTQAAELLGFTRQHFESFKAKYPGFPAQVGMKRPTVTRADGSTYVGTPYPVFDKSAVLKWIADNGIKRTRGAEPGIPRNLAFDNEMAQMFIRRPMVIAGF